jgi:hypothetical protein
MQGLTWKPTTSIFNAALRTTFGKLDEQDISEIDENYDRLASCLADRYEWDYEFAQSKIVQFRSAVLRTSDSFVSGAKND